MHTAGLGQVQPCFRASVATPRRCMAAMVPRCASVPPIKPNGSGIGSPPPEAPQGRRPGSQLVAAVRSPTVATRQAAPLKIISKPGKAEPLGASPVSGGVNFALSAPAASSVLLCLFDASGASIGEELPLTKGESGLWTILLEGCPRSGVLYGYRVDGEGGWETGYRWDPTRVLIDPYAKHVEGRRHWGVRDEFEHFQTERGSQFYGTFDFDEEAFDWGADYKRPAVPASEYVVYEVPLRTFTASDSSGVAEERRGTYLGFMDKIPHLVELGITAVEILPILEFDELEFQRSDNPRDHMVNVWGYSHMNFFAPMARFAEGGGGALAAAREFKQLVRALHAAGIEVILDVVYNHTNEGGDSDPYTTSFRGIDNPAYYMTDTSQYVQLLNYSGCGNTTNANGASMKELIMASLRMWVEEYHVDGFRFDLASVMCRDELGRPLESPPIVREIAKDPILSKVKLLAEPWDCGMYQVGTFPNWDVWGEWNGKFRDDFRCFIKGDAGMKKKIATRIAGSADLYRTNNRHPDQCINFIVAHDGFTLHDLVSYDKKRNDANGENNNDGNNDNFSWNCGEEGDTEDTAVLAMRQRQMRNFMVALLVSQGTPMVLAGDEYAATRGGNNNWYGHDSEMTWFDWKAQEDQRDTYFRFYSAMIKFRRSCPLLGRTTFLTDDDITWHEHNWDDDESRFLAFTYHDRGQGGGDVYVAFNMHDFAVEASLPSPTGGAWKRLVDTNLPPPLDFTAENQPEVAITYNVQPHSSIILIIK